jgi:hypothetical protein
MEDVSFNTLLLMWFQDDSFPPHYSSHEVRQYLSRNYSGRWTCLAYEAPGSWPVHSPYVYPTDFVFCGAIYENQNLYQYVIDPRDESWHRIHQFSSKIKK